MTTDRPPAAPPAPRVLIPITIHFAIRYVVRTGLLDLIGDAWHPVLALSWDDPELAAELEGLGHEVIRLPDPRVDPPVRRELQLLDAHFAARLRSPTSAIDRARQAQGWRWRKRARRAIDRAQVRATTMVPGSERRAAERLHAAVPTGTNVADYEALLREARIDALFTVTPFTSQEEVLLLAAERVALPRCTSILSFDNITARPRIPVGFDRTLVWNRLMVDEILRGYPSTPPTSISIVGPAQFDFYRDPRLVIPQAEWREGLGIAPGAPTVLYGAGVTHIAPHEAQYVDDLLRAIRDGELPADLRIVLRRHPLDRPERWARLLDDPAIAWDDPGKLGGDELRPGQVGFDEQQIVGLCSSLAHADVHASASSTMTLDGACFDRPQIGPAYDAVGDRAHDRHARALYEREHFVPIVASGGIDLVTSPEAFVASVRRHLADRDAQRAGRERMLEVMCTHTDGRNTARVAAEVRAFLAEVAARR